MRPIKRVAARCPTTLRRAERRHAFVMATRTERSALALEAGAVFDRHEPHDAVATDGCLLVVVLVEEQVAAVVTEAQRCVAARDLDAELRRDPTAAAPLVLGDVLSWPSQASSSTALASASWRERRTLPPRNWPSASPSE